MSRHRGGRAPRASQAHPDVVARRNAMDRGQSPRARAADEAQPQQALRSAPQIPVTRESEHRESPRASAPGRSSSSRTVLEFKTPASPGRRQHHPRSVTATHSKSDFEEAHEVVDWSAQTQVHPSALVRVQQPPRAPTSDGTPSNAERTRIPRSSSTSTSSSTASRAAARPERVPASATERVPRSAAVRRAMATIQAERAIADGILPNKTKTSARHTSPRRLTGDRPTYAQDRPAPSVASEPGAGSLAARHNPSPSPISLRRSGPRFTIGERVRYADLLGVTVNAVGTSSGSGQFGSGFEYVLDVPGMGQRTGIAEYELRCLGARYRLVSVCDCRTCSLAVCHWRSKCPRCVMCVSVPPLVRACMTAHTTLPAVNWPSSCSQRRPQDARPPCCSARTAQLCVPSRRTRRVFCNAGLHRRYRRPALPRQRSLPVQLPYLWIPRHPLPLFPRLRWRPSRTANP